MWDVANLREVATMWATEHRNVNAMVVLRDGQLATGTGKCIQVWDVGRPYPTCCTTIPDGAFALTLLHNGRLAVVSSTDHGVRIMNTHASAVTTVLPAKCLFLVELPDGRIVCAMGTYSSKIWPTRVLERLTKKT